MRTSPAQFLNSPTQEPHRDRTKMLLRDHAELRRLIGKNPCTALMILGCVYLQVGLACLLRDAPWWLILLTAFTIGACLSHALWTLIHECAHNLVFAKTYLNTLASITANLPHLLPSARTARGRVALNDEFKPDVEFLEASPRA
jgi:sphingolipid delta-4 desaturase